MRILHAYKIYKPDVEGGIPQVIATLTHNTPDDINSSIVVARSSGPTEHSVIDGVPVNAAYSFGTAFSTPISPAYLRAFLKGASTSDLIVHHAPFPLTDIALLAQKSRIPLVVHWHAEIIGRSLLKSALMPAIISSLKRAAKIIVAHPIMIQQSDLLKRFSDKCVAIPYGTDINYWSKINQLKVKAGQNSRSESSRLLVAIGRLVPYKGFSLLLQALQDIDAKLVLIGEGDLLPNLRRQANILGIEDRVVFAGKLPRSEMRALLQTANALVMPSISSAEAFGIVQIEAMAAGCPVINTNISTAVPFVARHKLEGLTVSVGDVAALREAILLILDNPEYARKLGNAAELRVRAEFDEDLFRQRNFDLYRSIVSDLRP